MDIILITYYICIGVGVTASSLMGFFIGKKAGLPPSALKSYVAIAVVTGIFSALLMGQLQNFIMSLTSLPYYPSRLRIFGVLLFMPVFLFLFAKMLGGDYNKVMDAFTPGTYVMLGISKIGCAVYGCCYGIACTPGVTTQFEEHTVFPVQLLECVLCLAIGLSAYLFSKRKNHITGSVYPLSLILYGVTRFFSEYLRYYPEAERTYFFGVSFWQMIAVICVAVGIISVAVRLIHKTNPQQ